MRHIEVVGDAFAIIEDRVVIGVVSKCSKTQWGFYPLVPGETPSVVSLALQFALAEAIKFKRTLG
jgi:hypothetical protein